MKNFLKDIRIVGATMAFREGELLRYCLDDLLKYCDDVVVLLDNNDQATLDVVMEYDGKYSNFYIIHSKIPGLEDESRGRLKQRLANRQGEIRDRLLGMLRQLNIIIKIDLLVWPDGDEVFTEYFWNEYLK